MIARIRIEKIRASTSPDLLFRNRLCNCVSEYVISLRFDVWTSDQGVGRSSILWISYKVGRNSTNMDSVQIKNKILRYCLLCSMMKWNFLHIRWDSYCVITSCFMKKIINNYWGLTTERQDEGKSKEYSRNLLRILFRFIWLGVSI